MQELKDHNAELLKQREALMGELHKENVATEKRLDDLTKKYEKQGYLPLVAKGLAITENMLNSMPAESPAVPSGEKQPTIVAQKTNRFLHQSTYNSVSRILDIDKQLRVLNSQENDINNPPPATNAKAMVGKIEDIRNSHYMGKYIINSLKKDKSSLEKEKTDSLLAIASAKTEMDSLNKQYQDAMDAEIAKYNKTLVGDIKIPIPIALAAPEFTSEDAGKSSMPVEGGSTRGQITRNEKVTKNAKAFAEKLKVGTIADATLFLGTLISSVATLSKSGAGAAEVEQMLKGAGLSTALSAMVLAASAAYIANQQKFVNIPVAEFARYAPQLFMKNGKAKDSIMALKKLYEEKNSEWKGLVDALPAIYNKLAVNRDAIIANQKRIQDITTNKVSKVSGVEALGFHILTKEEEKAEHDARQKIADQKHVLNLERKELLKAIAIEDKKAQDDAKKYLAQQGIDATNKPWLLGAATAFKAMTGIQAETTPEEKIAEANKEQIANAEEAKLTPDQEAQKKAEDDYRAQMEADIQAKMELTKRGRIIDSIVDGVKGISQSYRKIEQEYAILGQTIGVQDNAKIMEGVWRSIIDGVIAAGGSEEDIPQQWKDKYKEAHDALVEMERQKSELDRLASSAGTMLGAEKDVDSAKIAIASVLPGDIVGMMRAQGSLRDKQLTRDYQQEMIDAEKRHQEKLFALKKANIGNDGKGEELENQQYDRFKKQREFEYQQTKATYDMQLEAALAYQEKLKALRESDAVDALGKVFGLGAEQQKYMKLGATRQDKATMSAYAAAGMALPTQMAMSNAQNRLGYTGVLSGFANIGGDYAKIGADLNKFQFNNPVLSGNEGVLYQGQKVNWEHPGIKYLDPRNQQAVISQAESAIQQQTTDLKLVAGENNVQVGKLTIDNNINLEFSGEGKELIQKAKALTTLSANSGR